MERAPLCLRSRLFLLAAGVLLSAIIAWASFANLANYPTLWWDEAIFSETAANLVQHGRYAFTDQSPDQLSDLDHRISAGPALILPVALAYRFLGVGLVNGRLVAALYLAFAFLALFLGARRLFGAAAGLLAVAMVLLGTDVIHWGRSVLGDVPALALFLGGLWLITRSLEEESCWSLFLGGLLLGLGFDAKEFYGIAFLPPLAALAWRDWGAWRRLLWRGAVYASGVALPVLSYLALKAVILGGLPAAVMHFLEQKTLLRHEFFTPFTIGRVYGECFRYLFTSPLYLLGLLGGWWLWRTGRLTPARALWLGNFVLWSLMYFTAIFWHRFALPALFLAAPLAAAFLCRLLTGVTARLAPWPRLAVTVGLLVGFFTYVHPTSGWLFMEQIVKCQHHPPNRLANYLRSQVPFSSLIETPEYELVFLNDEHRIHLMPAYYIVESEPGRVVLLDPRPQPYDFNQIKADILVLGDFGKSIFAQVYDPARIARHWRKVAQIDNYDIYQRRSPPSPVRTHSRAPLFPSSSQPPLKSSAAKVHVPRTSGYPLSQ